MELRKYLIVVALLFGASWSGMANALSVNVGIDGVGDYNWVWPEGHRVNSVVVPGVWDFAWDVDSDADPFIQINSLSFTNTSSATQSFVVSLSGPVSPSFNPANVIDAQMGYDWIGDGNTSITNISWQGTINGTTVSTIFGSNVNVIGIPLNGTVGPNTDPAVPFVYNAGGPITSMGMIFSFDLSAGDTIDFNARMEITPVPLPSALFLFATGLFGLVGIIRRR